MQHRKLTFETLQHRELLTANTELFDDLNVTESETFSLDATDTDNSILLTNQSTVPARFTMRFNGNISVNTQDLVQQIRDFEVPGEPDMPDYEKAYHYLMEFHGHDRPLTGRTWMHEPSLYLNSIGAGLCDDAASALKLIWNGMGYESRVWLLSGHVVSEVYTGERWEMYDADLRLVYYNDDMQVAGVEELMENPHYIYSPKVRFDQADGSGVSHSKRTASFFWTTENNRVCTACTTNLPERDLVFEIPAGGTLQVGEITPERDLPNSLVQTSSLGLLTVTIPANSTGSLNIPLVLYDISGGPDDSVQLGDATFSLGTDAAFSHLNDEGTDSRFDAVTYANNSEPIQVHYLMNKQLTELLDQNVLEINHIGEATDLQAQVQGPLAKQFDFSDAAASEVVYFDGTEHFDVQDQEVSALLHSERNFEINATIQVDADDATRRPVADSFRFSFEIDDQNRPYAYYRASNNRWVGVRGQALPSNEMVDLKVRYEDGTLSLFVNGDLQGQRAGAGLHRDYLVQDLKIGGSSHMGGLFFKGHIDQVSIRELQDHEFEFQSVAVDEALEIVQDNDDEQVLIDGETNSTTPTENTVAQPEDTASTDAVLGDLTGDGLVTFDDFMVFAPNFGKSGENLAGDFDSDGQVSFLDFVILFRALSDAQS